VALAGSAAPRAPRATTVPAPPEAT
jgi:hypothetical protein